MLIILFISLMVCGVNIDIPGSTTSRARVHGQLDNNFDGRMLEKFEHLAQVYFIELLRPGHSASIYSTVESMQNANERARAMVLD